jgi:putative hydrolase of the HAD superfamily
MAAETSKLSPQMNRIRAITLDLDDTLWEIGPVIRNAEASLRTWLADNFPNVPERFSTEDMLELRREVMESHPDMRHDLRFVRKQVLARVAVESGYDADELVEPAFSVFDRARNAVDLYPDVIPELEVLFERFTLVAVTNGNANLQKIGIRHLFHGVVTAVDAGVAKPARPIFDAAVSAAGVEPDEILHVGDHPETDIDGARRAGLRTAWINRTAGEWPEHIDAPDAVITTIRELRELLESGE